MCETEEWAPISGEIEGVQIGSFYDISSTGRIRKGAKILKLSKFSSGYMACSVRINGWSKTFRVHRLVAFAFIGRPPFPDAEVNHINGNKEDNRAENLEWVSAKENTAHAIKHGFRTTGRTAKLTDADVYEIKRLRAKKTKRRVVAEMFGVTTFNIKAIDLGKTWRHIN